MQPPSETTELVPFSLSGDQLEVRDFNRKLHPIPTPANLTTEAFRRLVIAAYAEFVIEGEVTPEGMAVRAGMPPEAAQVALGAPEFAQALSHRGVSLNRLSGLSEKQDMLLLILGDPNDGLTMSQKLRKAGVSNAQYQAWMQQPIFAKQVRRLAEQLHNRSDEAMLQLSRLANEGNLNAIRFLFEMNGRYNPTQQQNLDVMVMMSKVLESISRHVKDPVALEAIAADIRLIAAPASNPQITLTQE